jgi:hypothetical protein
MHAFGGLSKRRRELDHFVSVMRQHTTTTARMPSAVNCCQLTPTRSPVPVGPPVSAWANRDNATTNPHAMKILVQTMVISLSGLGACQRAATEHGNGCGGPPRSGKAQSLLLSPPPPPPRSLPATLAPSRAAGRIVQ